MKVLIDNGHGCNTAGKRSPDGKLMEYAWTREIADLVVMRLKADGIDATLITPEDIDVPLKERVKRINEYCALCGSGNCLLVSVHNNAAMDNGIWNESATGWSVFVSKNASSKSKDMADMMYSIAKDKQLLGNRAKPKADADGKHYWTWSWTDKDIYILSASNCPAVLTENLFMDNRNDCAYLLSDRGKKELVDMHVDAIKAYVQKYR